MSAGDCEWACGRPHVQCRVPVPVRVAIVRWNCVGWIVRGWVWAWVWEGTVSRAVCQGDRRTVPSNSFGVARVAPFRVG